MAGKNQKRLVALFLAAVGLLPVPVSAQEQSDSLVRFVKGASIQLIEKDGQTLRKAVDATFLHNGTYLICDTALWDVNRKVIQAEGNVRIIQDETTLSSDRLDYDIEGNLAEFRGSVVSLQDKQNNILKTRHLDYNTKDSIAVFRNGGSMKDKDGQIIESLEGTYDSKAHLFSFRKEVNMFTDSVFVKTDNLDYASDSSRAVFGSHIDFWKDGNMMSASGGWYDRPREIFFFSGDVHGMTSEQESWSDSLYFYRLTENVRLLGNAQVQDTTRNIAGLADYIFYEDSLARVTMRKRAAVAIRTSEKKGEDGEEKLDTLYFGADTLRYYTVRKCDVPETEINEAATRVVEMFVDPVKEYREKAAKEAAEAAANALREHQEETGEINRNKAAKPASEASASEEETPEPDDMPARDSVKEESASMDTTAVAIAPDTTRIGFLEGIRNVRIYRKDIQVSADSMRYSDLDSIARFYKDPIVWNEGNRQYSSDSLFVLVRNNGVDRANLMSEAFIITQEDSLYFDQIKATEVMAYFDTTSALRRFDALGGASAFFYLQENDAFATMNKVESKMLSAVFKNGDIDRVYYFDSPKNDAYPLAQVRMEDQRMRGFNWQVEKRPASRADVTTLELKPSERIQYLLRPRASFLQTDIYFPGYIESVYKGISVKDSLKRARRAEEERMEKEKAEKDTLVAPVDTAVVEIHALDTLAVPETPKDTIAIDTTASLRPLTPAEIRKAEAEARRKARLDARDAKWAELDARDAAKAEEKAKKALEKKRARTRRDLIRKQKQEAKDAARLERYKARYAARKARQEAKKTKGINNGETD